MKNSVILTSPLRLMTPIIKVVGNFCNCRCRYCFYHMQDQSRYHLMSNRLLEKFIRQYMNLFSGHLDFIWHGGEPLLAGIDFFQRVINFQLKYLRDGQRIQNHIQTNGILINHRWADFLKLHNFRVGVSLDGCKESHNHFRRDGSGKGTFDKVINGIQILRQYGLEPGVMQTLTAENLDRIKDDFSFFTDILRVRGWGTNIYLDLQEANKAMILQSISPNQLTMFLEKYINLWFSKDDPNLRIREIENFIAGIFGKAAPNCTFNGSCTGYFCLDYDGKIYPCDRLSNNPDFSFGDLSRQSLIEVLNSNKRLKYADEVNSLHPDCTICEWQKACHNGCSAYRVGGFRGKYYYCETRKKIFDYLGNRVKNLNEKTA